MLPDFKSVRGTEPSPFGTEPPSFTKQELSSLLRAHFEEYGGDAFAFYPAFLEKLEKAIGDEVVVNDAQDNERPENLYEFTKHYDYLPVPLGPAPSRMSKPLLDELARNVVKVIEQSDRPLSYTPAVIKAGEDVFKEQLAESERNGLDVDGLKSTRELLNYLGVNPLTSKYFREEAPAEIKRMAKGVLTVDGRVLHREAAEHLIRQEFKIPEDYRYTDYDLGAGMLEFSRRRFAKEWESLRDRLENRISVGQKVKYFRMPAGTFDAYFRSLQKEFSPLIVSRYMDEFRAWSKTHGGV